MSCLVGILYGNDVAVYNLMTVTYHGHSPLAVRDILDQDQQVQDESCPYSHA